MNKDSKTFVYSESVRFPLTWNSTFSCGSVLSHPWPRILETSSSFRFFTCVRASEITSLTWASAKNGCVKMKVVTKQKGNGKFF